MCTCFALRQKSLYFGRNMDLDYNFGEKIVITPRDFPLKSLQEGHCGFLGTAAIIDGYPLYADAMNENGLCIAGLNFPEKSFYRAPIDGKINVPAYDFIAYVAAKYSSVADFRADFCNFNITNTAFSKKVPSPTLHWMISDSNSSVVIESTEQGIDLYENPLNVMTNLPEFPEHVENYRKTIAEEGSVPDTISSESRFLRIAHFLGNNLPEEDSDSLISHAFCLLGTVSVPDGTKRTPSGRFHKTTYSVCFDVLNQRYFIRTSENSRISFVELTEKELTSTEISLFEIPGCQDYIKLN